MIKICANKYGRNWKNWIDKIYLKKLTKYLKATLVAFCFSVDKQNPNFFKI